MGTSDNTDTKDMIKGIDKFDLGVRTTNHETNQSPWREFTSDLEDLFFIVQFYKLLSKKDEQTELNISRRMFR